MIFNRPCHTADNMAQKTKVQTLSGFFCTNNVICSLRAGTRGKFYGDDKVFRL